MRWDPSDWITGRRCCEPEGGMLSHRPGAEIGAIAQPKSESCGSNGWWCARRSLCGTAQLALSSTNKLKE